MIAGLDGLKRYQELIARKNKALEFNRQDAITAAGSDYYEEQIA